MAPSKHRKYSPIVQSSESDEKNSEVPFSDLISDESFLLTRIPLPLLTRNPALPWISCAFFATLSGILTFLLLQQRIGINNQQRYLNDFSKSITETGSIMHAVKTLTFLGS
jgi:hypothetical protein